MKAKNWMWCVQNKKGKLIPMAVDGGTLMVGFVTKRGLIDYTGGLPDLDPGDRIIKVEFRLPRVPKAKKVLKRTCKARPNLPKAKKAKRTKT